MWMCYGCEGCQHYTRQLEGEWDGSTDCRSGTCELGAGTSEHAIAAMHKRSGRFVHVQKRCRNASDVNQGQAAARGGGETVGVLGERDGRICVQEGPQGYPSSEPSEAKV